MKLIVKSITGNQDEFIMDLTDKVILIAGEPNELPHLKTETYGKNIAIYDARRMHKDIYSDYMLKVLIALGYVTQDSSPVLITPPENDSIEDVVMRAKEISEGFSTIPLLKIDDKMFELMTTKKWEAVFLIGMNTPLLSIAASEYIANIITDCPVKTDMLSELDKVVKAFKEKQV